MHCIVLNRVVHRSLLDYGSLLAHAWVCECMGEHDLISPLDVVEEFLMPCPGIPELCYDPACFSLLLVGGLKAEDVDPGILPAYLLEPMAYIPGRLYEGFPAFLCIDSLVDISAAL